jgi:nucleotide-binding universal stress UspA family protein
MLEHRNILVPIDGSEKSQRALHAAQLLAKETPESRLYLIYVATEYQLKNRDEKDFATKLMADKAKETMNMGISVSFEIVEGDAREVIALTYPETHDCDLIVISSTGRGKLDRMLMGSVANYVLHYAKQDTVLIR